MYPLNDNDLDRLSREAAEQYDVEASTSGWETLENRLNRELPLKEEKERRRFLFWLFLIVLLAGGGLLWTMTNRNTVQVAHINATQDTTPAANQPSPNVGTTPAPAGATSAVPESEANTLPAGTIITPEDVAAGKPLGNIPQPNKTAATENDKKESPLKKKAAQTPADGDREEFLVIGEMPSSEKTQPTKRHKKQPVVTNSTDAGETAINNQPPVTGDQSKQESEITGNLQLVTSNPEPETVLHPSIVADVVWNNKPEGIQAPSLNPAVTPAPQNAPIENKHQREKGLQIGLVAGPDMSNVKFTDMDKAGYNVGLQIGYRFSDRWSVNTGIFYTKKNYTAQGKDFTKPNTNWWQTLDLHGVTGYCEMFDIPLNIRYDFSVSQKQRWFASAGASSYIMTGEYYTYDYTYGGTRRQVGYPRDSASNYLFSIVNLSAGFERTLNKRLSLQAEPYFKFPLKGLGYGKLDLNSYGIYFSVKYKLTK
ncbi:MAG: outer membrane beta-barrel protein [Niastella sp.]|nr:outer membrane beta-barrel protein [Niastella sp.]